MAHKKAGGTASNLRDSNAQRLGVRLFAGEKAKSGNIIVKQRGTKFRAGLNSKRANDDSIFATNSGVVKFRKKIIKKYDGKLKSATYIDIV